MGGENREYEIADFPDLDKRMIRRGVPASKFQAIGRSAFRNARGTDRIDFRAHEKPGRSSQHIDTTTVNRVDMSQSEKNMDRRNAEAPLVADFRALNSGDCL
jgi:hypothetical protein